MLCQVLISFSMQQHLSRCLHAAVEAGVQRVVCLSTDKAAYPINTMGISKAVMEKVIGANASVAAGKTTKMEG